MLQIADRFFKAEIDRLDLGAVVGVPLNIASAVVIVQGAGNVTAGFGNFVAIEGLRTEQEIAGRKAGYRRWRDLQRTSGFGVPVEPATRSALELLVAVQAGTVVWESRRSDGRWRAGMSVLSGTSQVLATWLVPSIAT